MSDIKSYDVRIASEILSVRVSGKTKNSQLRKGVIRSFLYFRRRKIMYIKQPVRGTVISMYCFWNTALN